MNDIIKAGPGIIERFEGASFGPLQRDRTLFFHDQPVVFTARSDDSRFWLVLLADEAHDRNTADWLVVETSAKQHHALDASEGSEFNQIGKLAIQAGHGATLLTVRCRDDAVIAERRVGVEEALQLGITGAENDNAPGPVMGATA